MKDNNKNTSYNHEFAFHKVKTNYRVINGSLYCHLVEQGLRFPLNTRPAMQVYGYIWLIYRTLNTVI